MNKTSLIVQVSPNTLLRNLPGEGILVAIEDLSLGQEVYFSLSQLDELLNKCNKKVYLLLDRYFKENELNKLKDFLSKYMNKVDGIFYSDPAVYQFSKQLGCEAKLVMSDNALITSQEELDAYLSLGINSALISPFITVEEIETILTLKPQGLILGYGHRRLAYSQRKFITAYGNQHDLKLDLDKTYFIREPARKESLRIREEETGTMIYEDKAYYEENLLKTAYKNGIEKVLLTNIFLSEEELVTKTEQLFRMKEAYE